LNISIALRNAATVASCCMNAQAQLNISIDIIITGIIITVDILMLSKQ